jgi:Fe-S-cluster-containing dehydrogenase component/CRP-like cAMP-binding protein
MVMLGRLHGDRWSAFGEHAGIQNLSSLLHPDQLKLIDILEEFDEGFLREISPDLTLAKWNAGATVFEEGAYLDLAFYLLAGEVEVFMAKDEPAHRPIFHAQVSPALMAAASVAGRSPAPAAPTGATVTFLASMDFDLARGDRMRLGPGEIFGEIGALNGWPQSATVRTTSPCTMLQIRLPALRKLRRKSKRLRQRLDELYRSRMLKQHLASTPLLEGCAPALIEHLAQRVELVSAQPDEVVVREGDAVEHLVLVRSGCLKLTQTVGEGQVVVSYVGKGSTVGEGELLIEGLEGWQVSAASVAHSELVRIARADLLDVIAQNPALEARLWGTASARIKEIGATRNDLQRSDLIDFTLQKGMAQANSVLVIDLERCTRCDDCVRACASTHGGVPRFVREGERYDTFLVARSCYHCQDPVCLVGCPTGAIRRANVGEVVAIDPSLCIGCSACQQNCPYDSIVMQPLDTVWGPDAVPKYLRGQQRVVATKCDLCYTSPQGPACVSSCPQGCATRVSSFEEFDVLLQAKRQRASQT